MKYYNFILKGNKQSIIEQIKECLHQYDIKYRKDIVNGCHKKKIAFNMMQIVIMSCEFTWNEKKML